MERIKKTGFDAYDVAVEITYEMRPIVAVLRRHDTELASEARRATQSIGLNLSEGRRRAGKDRLHHFRISLGSTEEVKASLDQAEGWGYIERPKTETVRALLDRELAMLWRLTGN